MNTYIDEDRGINFDINAIEAPAYLKAYLRHILLIENLTQNTVRTYYVQIKYFLRWLSMRDAKKNMDKETFLSEPIHTVSFDLVKSVREDDVYSFLAFSASILANDSSSRRLQIVALRSFFKYLFYVTKQIDYLPITDIMKPKSRYKLTNYLKPEECLSVLNAIDGPEHIRNRCIILFLMYGGMRLSELIGINFSDIYENSVLLRGKGRKERRIYLNNFCMDALSDWKKDRASIPDKDIRDKDAVFISRRRGQRLTGRRVEQIVKNAFSAAGIDHRGYKTHTLRHTAATLFYQSGSADILALQAMLGHASVSTTEIYTHLDPIQVKIAMSQDPIKMLLENKDNGDGSDIKTGE